MLQMQINLSSSHASCDSVPFHKQMRHDEFVCPPAHPKLSAKTNTCETKPLADVFVDVFVCNKHHSKPSEAPWQAMSFKNVRDKMSLFVPQPTQN